MSGRRRSFRSSSVDPPDLRLDRIHGLCEGELAALLLG